MKLKTTDISFITLYHQYFLKLKARLLKYYYLKHYQHVIDEDDIEQMNLDIRITQKLII